MMLPIESSCLIGNWMPENSVAKPAGPDEVEEEFMETLRQAAFIFEREKDGRFHGSIFACKAVARFIHRRGGGAELAGPFLQIAAAFEDLARGGKPRLFRKNRQLRRKGSGRRSVSTFTCLRPPRLKLWFGSRRAARALGTGIRQKGPAPRIGLPGT